MQIQPGEQSLESRVSQLQSHRAPLTHLSQITLLKALYTLLLLVSIQVIWSQPQPITIPSHIEMPPALQELHQHHPPQLHTAASQPGWGTLNWVTALEQEVWCTCYSPLQKEILSFSCAIIPFGIYSLLTLQEIHSPAGILAAVLNFKRWLKMTCRKMSACKSKCLYYTECPIKQDLCLTHRGQAEYPRLCYIFQYFTCSLSALQIKTFLRCIH